MATTISASSRLQVSANYAQQFTGITDTTSPPNLTKTLTWITGTGAGKAQVVMSQLRTLAASGTETFNINNGSLEDTLGLPLTIAKVKQVFFWLLSTTDDSVNGTNCTSIKIGDAAFPAFKGVAGFFDGTNPVLRCFNGGWVAFGTPTAGVAVAAGVSDQIKVVNEDAVNAAAYYVFLIGEN